MLVRSLELFKQLTANAPKTVVADVETRGQNPQTGSLLGIAIGFGEGSALSHFYVPFNEWKEDQMVNTASVELEIAVREFLRSKELVGHNIEYDRKWIDHCFGIKSAWKCDTRILWFLLDEEQIERGYGLKTAQTKILGWSTRGDELLDTVVKARGGRLDKGDHYLAPTPVLGNYAALDAKSTLELYNKLWRKLEVYRYVPFYRHVHAYNRMLARVTARGTVASLAHLKEGEQQVEIDIVNVKSSILKDIGGLIEEFNKKALEEQLKSYKTGRGMSNLLDSPTRWSKFNFRSNEHKIHLFYELLGMPITERTEKGRPKIDKSTIATFDHPVAKKFVELSELEKLASMMRSYIECVEISNDGLIHFPYNICGTVSGRLGGYKPYALNLPFDSAEAMRPFSVREGFIGIHSDLRSVEPCFIAAFSKDETLLKVHRDGLGDVYLDFALIAFPDNLELKEHYNPNIPVTDEVKARFKAIRNVCKIIHLAVGYTGTSITVAKNLSKNGFPTSEGKARDLVEAYWDKFSAVKDFNARCQQLLTKRGGVITNPFGRRVVVPFKFKKDSMNRLIQSTAHDALMVWVKEIGREFKRRGIEAYPLLPDTHDATSWEVKCSYEEASEVFSSTLADISRRLDLGISISCDTKQFNTFYGLKNSESK